MKHIKAISLFLFMLLAFSCVDRIIISVGKPKSQAVSIEGFISNLPGPYEVRIQNVYDVESKETTREPVSVKKLELIDDQGNSEEMKEYRPGFYQTQSGGIQGISGRAYKIRFELQDGRMYESLPDTLEVRGSLDSMYYTTRTGLDGLGLPDSYMDVFFDASYKASESSKLIWKFRATFQAETNPELYSGAACFYLDEVNGCNLVPPCSGYRNLGTVRTPKLVKKYPCDCCQCWYNIFNDELVISEDLFITKGEIKGKKMQSVPLNEWTLLHKIRIAVEQHNLSKNAYRFYKAIQNQKEAIGSLFQPISGEIPSNFKQLNGSTVRIEGLFYAAGVSRKVKYITKEDLPIQITGLLKPGKPLFADDCRYLFPHSTNVKPSFWID